MIRGTAHRLTEYLSRRIGDGLRTVIITADGSHELEYAHDDLSERYTERTLVAAATDLQVETSFSSLSSDSSPADERRVVVYCYGNAFVLQSPFSEAEQIIIGIGTGLGIDLLRFIEGYRCITDQENQAPGRSRTGVRSTLSADGGRRRRHCITIFSHAPDMGVMELVSVAALAENRIIGRDGELPWPSIPADKKQYQNRIADDPVVLGRATFEPMHDDLSGSV